MTFFGFEEDIEKETEFAIFGIPWDYLTSIDLPDSSIAPEKIRKVTFIIALTTELGLSIPDFKAVDLGDIPIEEKNVEKNLTTINDFIKNIYSQKKDIIPIMIGGDHFCSYPVIKAVGDHFEKKKEIGVIIFDSHLDFYQEWDKGVYSHATISHRVFDLDYINKNNLLIVGTRDIDIAELEIVNEENITYIAAHQLTDGINNYISRSIEFFKKNNVKSIFISIDIDVLDPSIAPGTGFAIPGGLSYREMWLMLKQIVSNFNVIGFDLVEVAPNLDLPNRVTCNLAAKLIVELMSFIVLKNQGKI